MDRTVWKALDHREPGTLVLAGDACSGSPHRLAVCPFGRADSRCRIACRMKMVSVSSVFAAPCAGGMARSISQQWARSGTRDPRPPPAFARPQALRKRLVAEAKVLFQMPCNDGEHAAASLLSTANALGLSMQGLQDWQKGDGP